MFCTIVVGILVGGVLLLVVGGFVSGWMRGYNESRQHLVHTAPAPSGVAATHKQYWS